MDAGYTLRVAARAHYRRCRVCGKLPAEVGPISARGLCREDSDARAKANNAHLERKKGEFYEHWYEAMRQRFEHKRVASPGVNE